MSKKPTHAHPEPATRLEIPAGSNTPTPREIQCRKWSAEQTIEDIYRIVNEYTPPIPTLNARIMQEAKEEHSVHQWTAKFRALLAKETDFKPLQPRASTLSKEHEAVIAAGNACPRCGGTGWETILCGGKVTDIMANYRFLCPCERITAFYKIWTRPGLLEERYRHANLQTLEPNDNLPISREDQQYIINQVKNESNATGSFFLYGAAGKGKTYILTTLYRRAIWDSLGQLDRLGLEDGDMVFRANTTELMSQIKEWDRRPLYGDDRDIPTKPTVTVEALEYAYKAGFRVSLFLDEIDKVTGRDQALQDTLTKLFMLIDSVYKHKGQIVFTSNDSPAELFQRWGKIAGSLIRRAGDDEDAITINFNNPRGRKTVDVVGAGAPEAPPTAQTAFTYPPFAPSEQADKRLTVLGCQKVFAPLPVPAKPAKQAQTPAVQIAPSTPPAEPTTPAQAEAEAIPEAEPVPNKPDETVEPLADEEPNQEPAAAYRRDAPAYSGARAPRSYEGN